MLFKGVIFLRRFCLKIPFLITTFRRMHSVPIAIPSYRHSGNSHYVPETVFALQIVHFWLWSGSSSQRLFNWDKQKYACIFFKRILNVLDLRVFVIKFSVDLDLFIYVMKLFRTKKMIQNPLEWLAIETIELGAFSLYTTRPQQHKLHSNWKKNSAKPQTFQTFP